MTKRVKLIGAALLALAAVPALPFVFHVSAVGIILALSGLAAGTATVTWASFQDGSGYHGGYTGGTTAPTNAQAATVNAQQITVLFGDTDTSAVLTHNFGVSAAQLAALQPYLSYICQQLTTPATGTLAVITVAWTNSNVITLAKQSNVGTGGSYVFTVRRPGIGQ